MIGPTTRAGRIIRTLELIPVGELVPKPKAITTVMACLGVSHAKALDYLDTLIDAKKLLQRDFYVLRVDDDSGAFCHAPEANPEAHRVTKSDRTETEVIQVKSLEEERIREELKRELSDDEREKLVDFALSLIERRLAELKACKTKNRKLLSEVARRWQLLADGVDYEAIESVDLLDFKEYDLWCGEMKLSEMLFDPKIEMAITGGGKCGRKTA